MESQIAANFCAVSERVAAAAAKHSKGSHVRLVAVSKTKPKEAVMAAYAAGARHFGENYVQELIEKASDPIIKSSCPDIKWHFIGRLQSNKVKPLLLKADNLWAVETVTSVKLADLLDAAWQTRMEQATAIIDTLNVMVQVNTSGEPQKGGVEPGNDLQELVRHIHERCPRLNLLGLMTIGLAGVTTNAENPDFARLHACRSALAAAGLGRRVAPTSAGTASDDGRAAVVDFELSMGMSADFEQAIAQGSGNVRVGSTIFGTRDYHEAKPTSSDASASG